VLRVLPVLLLCGCSVALRPTPPLNQLDVDGDGRVDRIETSDEQGEVVRVVEAPAPGSDPERTVVIALDAVPYEVFAGLQAEGLFSQFFPAARMIAPFPSLTNLGYTTIFKTPLPLGYEDRYYDREAGRIRGGMSDRLFNRYKNVAPFHQVFSWEPHHLWGAVIYYFPGYISRLELQRIEEMLHTSDAKELVLYFGGTDPLGHMRGWKGLADYLRLVDEMVTGFLAAGGADRRVVLFSDHGMSKVSSRPVDLKGSLKEAGFRLSKSLDRPGDVVAPAYGLVGSIQLYTMCDQEEAVARAVVQAEGVDFAVWREGVGIGAVSHDQAANPLDLPATEYPDLRHRIEAAFRGHSANPANVYVSLKDGWHWGSGLFELLVNIKGTHGSARDTSTLGFVTSNVDRLPEHLRAEDVFPYLGLSLQPEPPRPFTDPCSPPK